jgi:hypothetical protein
VTPVNQKLGKFAAAGSSGDTAFMIKPAKGAGQFAARDRVTLAHPVSAELGN